MGTDQRKDGHLTDDELNESYRALMSRVQLSDEAYQQVLKGALAKSEEAPHAPARTTARRFPLWQAIASAAACLVVGLVLFAAPSVLNPTSSYESLVDQSQQDVQDRSQEQEAASSPAENSSVENDSSANESTAQDDSTYQTPSEDTSDATDADGFEVTTPTSDASTSEQQASPRDLGESDHSSAAGNSSQKEDKSSDNEALPTASSGNPSAASPEYGLGQSVPDCVSISVPTPSKSSGQHWDCSMSVENVICLDGTDQSGSGRNATTTFSFTAEKQGTVTVTLSLKDKSGETSATSFIYKFKVDKELQVSLLSSKSITDQDPPQPIID